MIKISNTFKKYLSFVKFSHTVFALPFALIGFFMAVNVTGESLSILLLFKVILCMVFARNAAMGFNRYADYRFDRLNPRTAAREIPSGKITPVAALAFVIVNSLAFIVTTATINNLTLYLSPVALLIILGYSLTKRITALCHFILGLGLSLAPIGAYISVTGEFHLLPILFSFVVLSWVSGFDIIYALQDDEFDIENKLFSIPAKTGRTKALIISSLVHFATILFVVSAGFIGNYDIFFWIGAAIFFALLIYQHIIVKPGDLSRVNMAFATTNGIASIVFSIFVIFDMYIG
jgi:4-hydroxybenzoate polyprenyltransferase